MRIIYLLVVILTISVNDFSLAAGSRSMTVPERVQPSGKINTKYLYRHWLQETEEKNTDVNEEVYRPEGFKEFPPSRFRMQYIFYKNGTCKWYYLAPDDAHRFKMGTWKIDPKNKAILHIIKDNKRESYKVTELTKTVLKMTRI